MRGIPHTVEGAMSCLTVTRPVSPPGKLLSRVALSTSKELMVIFPVKSKEMTPGGRMNSRIEF